jgi:hypothetical protein
MLFYNSGKETKFYAHLAGQGIIYSKNPHQPILNIYLWQSEKERILTGTASTKGKQ